MGISFEEDLYWQSKKASSCTGNRLVTNNSKYNKVNSDIKSHGYTGGKPVSFCTTQTQSQSCNKLNCELPHYWVTLSIKCTTTYSLSVTIIVVLWTCLKPVYKALMPDLLLSFWTDHKFIRHFHMHLVDTSHVQLCSWTMNAVTQKWAESKRCWEPNQILYSAPSRNKLRWNKNTYITQNTTDQKIISIILFIFTKALRTGRKQTLREGENRPQWKILYQQKTKFEMLE